VSIQYRCANSRIFPRMGAKRTFRTDRLLGMRIIPAVPLFIRAGPLVSEMVLSSEVMLYRFR
jgi:hypothetical protein